MFVTLSGPNYQADLEDNWQSCSLKPKNGHRLLLFNSIELSGISSDKLRFKFGVPELFKRNLDVPKLRNGTRFQIIHLGPKAVLATDRTGIARGE
ncbi:hypothetical protein AVEN_140046-1 [Araneus ventricosus]|uniref:DNA helicase Pif1-like 2B domain-containing protein n=1 Tax=Araneus ventricosus TaxID=182803 RepID=A0A4Y2LGS5_ARAVE|nr:hypothetical protein AVEN_140046-1 [Araneus ventricosus]